MYDNILIYTIYNIRKINISKYIYFPTYSNSIIKLLETQRWLVISWAI